MQEANRLSGKTRKIVKTISIILLVLTILIAAGYFAIVPEFKNSVEYYRSCDVGDTLYMGKLNNKRIVWIVLAVEDTRILVTTKDAVAEMPYNDTRNEITWSDSSLRKWLNSDFIYDTFTEEEQYRILTTTVNAEYNTTYGTKPGYNTEDKLFLLSINEANKYFASDSKRICKNNKDSCWWWLRSPGFDQTYAALVSNDGSVKYDGFPVDYDTGAVRPALWINLES